MCTTLHACLTNFYRVFPSMFTGWFLHTCNCCRYFLSIVSTLLWVLVPEIKIDWFHHSSIWRLHTQLIVVGERTLLCCAVLFLQWMIQNNREYYQSCSVLYCVSLTYSVMCTDKHTHTSYTWNVQFVLLFFFPSVYSLSVCVNVWWHAKQSRRIHSLTQGQNIY